MFQNINRGLTWPQGILPQTFIYGFNNFAIFLKHFGRLVTDNNLGGDETRFLVFLFSCIVDQSFYIRLISEKSGFNCHCQHIFHQMTLKVKSRDAAIITTSKPISKYNGSQCQEAHKNAPGELKRIYLCAKTWVYAFSFWLITSSQWEKDTSQH